MIPFTLFILSGTAIATLLLAKRVEEKRRKTNFILKAISKGDERFRTIHHKSIHSYSIGKERLAFWLKKQLPMRSKNLWNKFQALVAQTADKYMGDIRNSRLLKKPDGISEFFKNISEIEKGGGEINEVYLEEKQIAESITAPKEMSVVEVKEIIEEKPLKLLRKRPSTPKAPRVKKVRVIEVVEAE